LDRAASRGDARDDGIKVPQYLAITDPKDAPSKPRKRSVSRRISTQVAFVVPAIDLDDEADLGAGEVDDEPPDDELPTKGEAGLRACQPAPEELLGAGGRKPHAACVLLEERCMSGGDERATEHGNLLSDGAQGGRRKGCDPRPISMSTGFCPTTL
jgi:hypothetical protein